MLHVLDRFHITSLIHKAIDQVRVQEARELKGKGDMPVLKGSRWVLLKNPEKRNHNQEQKLAELLKQNLKTAKSYLVITTDNCSENGQKFIN